MWICSEDELFAFYVFRLSQGKNHRDEPKGIVFLSNLLLLFQHCHNCFTPNPHVHSTHSGTMLTIETKCDNCQEHFSWKSRPYLLGKFPAGNLLLSFAILCAGAPVTKVLRVFKNMGLLEYNKVTYYYHQRHLLFPSVISYWRSYQKNILESLKWKEVVLAGDGWHDSMGHSAKYGTYTIFCCTVGLIIHLVVIQVNITFVHRPDWKVNSLQIMKFLEKFLHKIKCFSILVLKNLILFRRQTKQGAAQQWKLLDTKMHYIFFWPLAWL